MWKNLHVCAVGIGITGIEGFKNTSFNLQVMSSHIEPTRGVEKVDAGFFRIQSRGERVFVYLQVTQRYIEHIEVRGVLDAVVDRDARRAIGEKDGEDEREDYEIGSGKEV